MAKKNTSSSASSASKTNKKVTRRLAAAKKKSTKKKVAKKKSPKKSRKTVTAKGSKSSGKKKDANSVDGVLKKFVRERASLDVHLVALDKKIVDLEKKTKLYKEQLVSLGQDKKATLDSIAQIDSRRDLEVSQLLAKLGVKVSEVAPPAATTTVVFDVRPTGGAAGEHDEQANNGDTSQLGKANSPKSQD